MNIECLIRRTVADIFEKKFILFKLHNVTAKGKNYFILNSNCSCIAAIGEKK